MENAVKLMLKTDVEEKKRQSAMIYTVLIVKNILKGLKTLLISGWLSFTYLKNNNEAQDNVEMGKRNIKNILILNSDML